MGARRLVVGVVVLVVTSLVTYLTLAAIGVQETTSLSIGGVILICGIAFLLVTSREKKVGVIFIGLGFSMKALAESGLALLGSTPAIAAVIANLLLVAIIVTGIATAGRVAKLLWRTPPPKDEPADEAVVR